MAVPLVAGGVGLAASKRAENRRRQAAANAYSTKYPLLNDCPSMEASIQKAVLESKNIDASPAKTAGAKRVKKRNSDALRSWLLVMREHLRDLTCGINVASTSVAAAPALPAASTPISATTATLQDTAPAVLPQTEVGNVPAESGENLAAPTKKKGVNWILIGGVAVGAFLLFKYMKKN